MQILLSTFYCFKSVFNLVLRKIYFFMFISVTMKYYFGYVQIIFLFEVLINVFFTFVESSHSSTTRPSRYGIRCLAIARRRYHCFL